METIRNFSIEALQKLINHALKLDAQWEKKIFPLVNKQFLLEITDVNATVYVAFQEIGIEISAVPPTNEVDLVIRGNVLSLWRLFQSQADTMHTNLQAVRITGDLNLAQSIKNFFHGIQIDWEEQLSHFTGDIVAHQFFRGFSALREWQQEAVGNFKLNFKEYLQEEVRYVPVSVEVDDFLQAVDVLCDDVERLEVRIERLFQDEQE